MEIIQQWVQADSDYIREKVIEYNSSKIPDELKHPVQNVSFMIRDDKGKIVGGITGVIFWHRMYIDFLWIEESLRGKGYGKKLLDNIEQVAREHNCIHIQLDTFSFQAPGFYQKNGYSVVGLIEEHPTPDAQQYFLIKKLK